MLGLKRREGCGLQILDDQLRFVAIGGDAKLKQCHAEHLPPGAILNGRIVHEELVTEAVALAIKQLGIRGAGINLSVPTSSTVLRKTAFPAMNDRELRNRIDVELHSGSQMPFKDPVFDFIRLGSAEQGNSKEKLEEVLIFASPAHVVESYVRVVRAAGLKPLSVELAPLASLRLLLQYAERNQLRLPACFMIVHADAPQLEFGIYAGGVPVFLHVVADVMAGESYVKSLVSELNRMMYYFSYSISESNEEIQTIYLMGVDERLSELPQTIREIYEGPVHTISLASWLKTHEDPVQAYAVPLGLALKGA